MHWVATTYICSLKHVLKGAFNLNRVFVKAFENNKNKFDDFKEFNVSNYVLFTVMLQYEYNAPLHVLLLFCSFIPTGHSHTNEPTVFIQLAPVEHLLPSSHSSTSV